MKVIKGYGAPTVETIGEVNDFYVDLDTNNVYRCTSVRTIGEEWGGVTIYARTLDNTVYTWEAADVNPDVLLTEEGIIEALGYTPADDAEVTQLKSDLNEEVTARQNAVATETSERKAEIAVERERINQLSRLEEGSTTGDAELIDARVDMDGFTHDCVGDAIRHQNRKLSKKIDYNNENFDYSRKALSYEDANITLEHCYMGTDGEYVSYDSQNSYEFVMTEYTNFYVNFGVNDEYLQICVLNKEREFVARYRTSDANLPTKENTINVNEGDILIISTPPRNNQYWTISILSHETCSLAESVSLKDAHLKQINENINNINVIVEESAYIITLNGYNVIFEHTRHESSRANLWNIDGVTKNGNVIIPTGTDIVGVLKEVGETDFMGGVHGDETNVEMIILADGKPVTGNLKCRVLDIFMYSHLTRVSTGENVIDRYVHIRMENNSITIDTTFKCLVDNFALQIAYNGGMLAWIDSESNFAMSNTSVIDSTGLSNDGILYDGGHDLIMVSSLIDGNLITAENMIGHERESYKGQLYYYGNEENPRFKLYGATESNMTWNKGYTCKGKARYTLV